MVVLSFFLSFLKDETRRRRKRREKQEKQEQEALFVEARVNADFDGVGERRPPH